MPIAPNVAFNDLTNNVTGFLKKYPVRIFGATAASGVVAYCLKNRGASFRPGSVLGTLSMKATESFDIRAMAAIAAVGGVGNGQVQRGRVLQICASPRERTFKTGSHHPF